MRREDGNPITSRVDAPENFLLGATNAADNADSTPAPFSLFPAFPHSKALQALLASLPAVNTPGALRADVPLRCFLRDRSFYPCSHVSFAQDAQGAGPIIFTAWMERGPNNRIFAGFSFGK